MRPRDPCSIPVLLLIHRRPHLGAQVMAAIRQARPQHLLVAADGPAEDERCRQARQTVMEGIDWPCAVQTRFSETHLGCKRAVSSALDWAFDKHEQLIVLEDDCLPNRSFFLFCAEMLAHYAEDPRVMQVCGSNLLGQPFGTADYFFSRFGPIWGWASWRRAWDTYDVGMRSWPLTRRSGLLRTLCPEPGETLWRRTIFDRVHAGRIDTWDYQWAYAKLLEHGLSIIPSCNLVSNIGFGPDATHTRSANDSRSGMTTADLRFPLAHPENITACHEADRAYLHRIAGLPKSPWSPAALRQFVRALFLP